MASRQLLIGRCSRVGACYVVTTVIHRWRKMLQGEAALRVETEIRRCEENGWLESWAWVVMPDHVHWLFSLHEASLSRCVQAFKSRSAHTINIAIGGTGPVWQRGFYDHQLRDDEDLLAQARYLVGNPIRGGLVRRIEDYPHAWSRWPLRTEDL